MLNGHKAWSIGGVFLFVIGTWVVPASQGQPKVERVINALKSLHQSYSKLEIEFTSHKYRFSDQLDPLDSEHWIPFLSKSTGICLDHNGMVRTVAPDSFWVELEADCESGHYHRVQYSWHNGELRVLDNLGTEALTGTIDSRHRSGLFSSEHVLTPLGYRVFEDKQSLPALLASMKIRLLESENSSTIQMAGEASQPGGWRSELSLTVDQARDYLPVEVKLRKHKPDGGHYDFYYSVLESSTIEGVIIPVHAIYYLHHPDIDPRYDLTEWMLTSARRDTAISAESIVINFPQDAFVMDLVRAEQWVVGPAGQKKKTEQIAEDLASSIKTNIEGNARANELRESRRKIFPYIVGAAGLIAAVIFTVQWMRKV